MPSPETRANPPVADVTRRPFQRARRPEQREARRQAILDAAAGLLADMPVNDISLRELSRRVGLAKSNVLRYFETREAVFLELLDVAWREWLAELSGLREHQSDGTLDALADQLATSLAARPLLCELISATASVLERNISTAVAVRFKLAARDNNAALATWIQQRLPALDTEPAEQVAAASFAFVAGLWPLANPSASVVAAYADPCLAATRVNFADALRLFFATVLAGTLARSALDGHHRQVHEYTAPR